MRTREERQADRQARRNSVNGLVGNLINTVTGQTPTPVTGASPAPVIEASPVPPPTPELDTPAVDPQQEELSRQAREVMSGNVNPAQAEYFRQQNEDLFMRERKGTNPATGYNKLEKITGVNPVSNRKNDKMTELFGGLYGSEESRGF